MNTLTTSTGATIALDGDLLAVVEGLYQEVVARSGLTHTYEDMVKEVTHLVTQMTDDERRAYLVESLVLNTVRYENDKLAAIIRRLNTPAG